VPAPAAQTGAERSSGFHSARDGLGRREEWALLRLIQDAAIEVFVTIDGNLQYQQNLTGVSLSIIVLRAPDNTIESLRPLAPAILTALQSITAGAIVRVGN